MKTLLFGSYAAFRILTSLLPFVAGYVVFFIVSPFRAGLQWAESNDDRLRADFRKGTRL